MKNIAFFLLLGVILKFPAKPFNGVLHYESDYDNSISTGKVITTIYEADSKVRIESENIETKSSFGQPKSESQNVLLFDFDKKEETHLQAKYKRAMVAPYNFVLEMEQKMMDSLGVTVTVQNLGNEKIGNYNCTHFLMTTVNPKIKSEKLKTGKKDIWITKDLGSCHVWYVGPYLYYPDGTYLQKKLADAGADGVVVKWQGGTGDLTTSCTLVSNENKPVPASEFTPPTDFSIVRPALSTLGQRN